MDYNYLVAQLNRLFVSRIDLQVSELFSCSAQMRNWILNSCQNRARISLEDGIQPAVHHEMKAVSLLLVYY